MQILISDLSLEIPLACFTWGTWSQQGVLGPGKSSPGAGAAKKDLLQPVCVDTNNPSHRGLKITFWTVMEFSYVAIGGGMREYGCCRSGARRDLNHLLFATWEELGRLWVFVHTPAQLTCCRVSSLPRGLEEALHQHRAGTCPATSVGHGGGHAFYSHGQLQKSSSVPLSHLLMEELKQW